MLSSSIVMDKLTSLLCALRIALENEDDGAYVVI